MTTLFLQDISLYSKLGFLPIYSIGNLRIVAVYQVTEEIVAYCLNKYKKYKFIFLLKEEIYRLLYKFVYKDHDPEYSARRMKHRYVLLLFVIVLVLLIFNEQLFVFAMNILYLITTLFKLCTAFISSFLSKRYSNINLFNFPIYTIFIPIRDEKKTTIESIIKYIGKLDYPKDKLDVKLIVEERDVALIEKINVEFEIIKVPYSFPQTKAKACNYALNFAKGDYIAIYDADDRPDPLQLKNVLSVFNANGEIVCVQVPLNYYNYDYNHLTRFFALEYSSLFDFILPGMDKLHFPILLGGSSNHFCVNVLRRIGGWDQYSVTEDADLGIKLYRSGYKTYLLNCSETLEEAPIKIRSWVKQRARWIKGYIITYIVHMQKPRKLIYDIGLKSFLVLQIFMIIPIAVYLFSPIFFFIMISSGLNKLAIINIVLYLFSNLFPVFISIRGRRWFSLFPYGLLMPFYNLLHSAAGYRAIWQLFTAPYKWDKTEHDQALGKKHI